MMAARLGRVIYWLTCGLAVLALMGGAVGIVAEWPGKTPPVPADASRAAVKTQLSADNKQQYTFTFPNGARYLVEGPNTVLNVDGAREELRKGLAEDQERYNARWESLGLMVGLAIGATIGLFLFGRAARYILAGE